MKPPSVSARHSVFFNEDLRKIIRPIENISNKDKTCSDGVVTEPVESFHESALLFLLEIKNEIGTGLCDPTIQGSLSYVRRWAQEKFRCFRRIALAGPWICILGSVYLEKGIIDPLATFIPLVPFHHYSYHRRITPDRWDWYYGCREFMNLGILYQIHYFNTG
ncbi:hypothetical protein RhiirA4_269624 [Rhizophagus irregularis]|uniref:Uncharacterized protein n=1 Tax=Rhizophagus irregularis TaxID=588596 RepID=A0A2I1GVM6_9GLOM|nr:hypothetical protein RhiirA4_269624 [Rhizophagus irregularis]